MHFVVIELRCKFDEQVLRLNAKADSEGLDQTAITLTCIGTVLGSHLSQDKHSIKVCLRPLRCTQ